MEREEQLELLEKLIEVYIKNSLWIQVSSERNILLAKGLDSLSKILSKKCRADVVVRDVENSAAEKIDKYCRIWAKKIVGEYDLSLKE